MESNINIECNFIELLQNLNINNGDEYTHKIIDSGKNRVEIIYSKTPQQIDSKKTVLS